MNGKFINGVNNVSYEGVEQGENGTISIKGGVVVVCDPSEGGRRATISPCPNVKIYVDGTLIDKKTEVDSKSNIVLAPEEIPGDYKISIRVDRKKMEAFAAAEYVPGKLYIICDTRPVTDLNEIRFEIGESERKPLTPEELRRCLTEKGIVHGIDNSAIIKVVSFSDGQEVLVASGTAPQPGEDARIELCFREGEYIEKNEDDLWVDNFDYGTIASAEAGMVVARKHPAKPGIPGMDVTGKKLEPPIPRDFQLKAGSGVEISKNGLEAVALVNGRPQVKGYTVSVTPQYKVSGDVDSTTGNLNFSGDIVIEGSVQDGMKVRARGDIKILGFATHCVVEAGGNVEIIKNVVGSEIKAGGSKINLYPIQENLHSLVAYFLDLMKVLDQFLVDPRIKDRPEVRKYGYGAMLKILLDTRFSQIGVQLKELESLVESVLSGSEVILDEGLRITTGKMRQKFSGTGPLEFKTIEEIINSINDFLECAQSNLEKIEYALLARSSITVGYVQHSKLEATGNVIITGKGCYNTNITCRGDVICKDKKGFFRGGEIKAGGNVDIYELGSLGGAPTRVEVPSSKAINSAVTHQGVVLKVGRNIKVVGTKVGDFE